MFQKHCPFCETSIVGAKIESQGEYNLIPNVLTYIVSAICPKCNKSQGDFVIVPEQGDLTGYNIKVNRYKNSIYITEEMTI